MRRLVGGLLCVGALLASGVLATPAAVAKSTCGNYKVEFKVGSLPETNDFTQIKLVGVSCTMAHKVLGRWATAGVGGTDLGFVCTEQRTSTKNVLAVKCTEGTQVIKARDKNTL